jgi:hypothetical protein
MNDSPIDWSQSKIPQPRAPTIADGGGMNSSDDVDEAMASAAGERRGKMRQL